MARVDKTESAIGVTRGTLKADVPNTKWNVPLGVGIDSAGLVVLGAGQSGVVGIAIFDRTNYRATSRVDIFGNGSEIVEVKNIAAGTKVYATTADGTVSSTATAATYVGYTVEADRLVVTL